MDSGVVQGSYPFQLCWEGDEGVALDEDECAEFLLPRKADSVRFFLLWE